MGVTSPPLVTVYLTRRGVGSMVELLLAIGCGVVLFLMLLGFFAVATTVEPPLPPRGRRSPVALPSRSRGPQAPVSNQVERVRPH